MMFVTVFIILQGVCNGQAASLVKNLIDKKVGPSGAEYNLGPKY